MAQFQENGPFAVNSPGVVTMNPWAWNRKANVVWIESPAGVGFSYSNTTSDYSVGDARTTADAVAFLQRFLFEYFPQHQAAAVWTTGESYGGHYVPLFTLAAFNTRSSARPINIKGMMVGNAWTDAANDNAGALEMWWTHAIIDRDSVDAVTAACNLSDIGPLTVQANQQQQQQQRAAAVSCSHAVNYVQSVAFADIDIYDLLVDNCNVNTVVAMRTVEALSAAGSVAHRILAGAAKQQREQREQQQQQQQQKKRQFDPCSANNLEPYLNDPTVQAALNAIVGTQWSMCSSVVDYERKSVLTSMLPVYQKLFQAGVHVMIYSGDIDGIVPVLGTLKNVAALKRPVKTSWRSWYVTDQYGKQVGGFVTVYDKFTFATVRGAGHMVPEYRPQRAFVMFEGFLHNQTLPTH